MKQDSRTSETMKPAEKEAQTIMKVFLEEIKDIYGAEKQLMQALPEMAKAADSEELKDAFETHLEQTKEHAKRLEQVFAMLGEDREAKKCKAMEGLIQEGKDIIKDFDKGPVRDCALIIGAQKVEHYEIAAYGSLCELAEVMGKHKIANILDTTLEEEEETDTLLTSIAESVNECALEAKDNSTDDTDDENSATADTEPVATNGEKVETPVASTE